jgi:hypothetical protein
MDRLACTIIEDKEALDGKDTMFASEVFKKWVERRRRWTRRGQTPELLIEITTHHPDWTNVSH